MRRYRNHEGYCDPTAGQAMETITREERRRRKALLVQEEQKSPGQFLARIKGLPVIFMWMEKRLEAVII